MKNSHLKNNVAKTNGTCNNKCNWFYASKCKDKVMKYADIKKYVNELKKLERKKYILKKE